MSRPRPVSRLQVVAARVRDTRPSAGLAVAGAASTVPGPALDRWVGACYVVHAGGPAAPRVGWYLRGRAWLVRVADVFVAFLVPAVAVRDQAPEEFTARRDRSARVGSSD
jgi:hypothetical protein